MKDTSTSNIPVAIIGMGCFFARSNGLEEYWRLLFQGKDAISEVPDSHWSPADYFDKDPEKPDHVYCKRGGFLSPIDFDPTQFGIPPNLMEATDTSQLLALLAAQMALHDAGYMNGKPFNRKKTSVILGATGTQELSISLGARLGHPHWRRALTAAGVPSDQAREVIEHISNAYSPWRENSFPGLLGNVIAGRICNRLDLGGTNCVVDAACASSLSAVHLSLMELMVGRSDMVLTGGVDLLNDIFMHMCFSKTRILSPTEDIRPFSKDADGTLLGEGVGMLALKRLSDARRDGDKIYAVIKAIGSSSDGRSQSIYAPRTKGQEKALHMAYDLAGVSPSTVQLVEAHGTGTRVGDQVEFQTLKQVFGDTSENGHQCALGSVKSMIGHAKAAAGSAGLIKATLALYHKVLPPTLKALEPDPNLGIEKSPFYLNHSTRPWFSNPNHPRRSGVSSFGFGGSNFHVVLEEYKPEKSETAWDGSVQIMAFSANCLKELATRIESLTSDMTADMSYPEFAYRMARSRKSFSPSAIHRLLVPVERDLFDIGKVPGLLKEISHILEKNDPFALGRIPNLFYGQGENPGKVAFLFPGQGSQYVNMGKDLICIFPEAFQLLEKADKIFQSRSPGVPLTERIYPLPATSPSDTKALESALRQTQFAQPAIGGVSMAMVKILERFLVRPDACCGHSFGELTALCAAGWIDIESLHVLAVTRGQSMEQAGKNQDGDSGTMLAVLGPLNELSKRLEKAGLPVVLANKNSPLQGVLSGPSQAIAQAETKCSQWGFKTKALPVSAAFHSILMEGARKPFSRALNHIQITPGNLPVYSNVTGAAYPTDSNQAKILLSKQLVSPVDFLENIHGLYNNGVRTFVEVGPKSVLTGLVKETLTDESVHAIALDDSAGRQPGVLNLAQVLCGLAARGFPVALEQWETPATQPISKRMNIPISGANFRPEPPFKDSAPDSEHIGQPAKETQTPAIQSQCPDSSAAVSSAQKSERDHTMSRHNISDAATQALKVTEQGLKSMQALQLQTAEAHQKFLETQAEASKALQALIANAQHMTSMATGTHSPEPRDNCSADDLSKHSAMPAPAEETASCVSTDVIASSDLAHTNAVAIDDTAPAGDTDALARTLLSVVSRLTGYPEDMLGLDMDIESDLGIDSIKRVEILSAMEESMPGLAPVSPEIMGSLKTLGQIIEHLSAAAPAKNRGSKTTNPTDTASIASGMPADHIRNTLLSVVSRLTGYPEDMLGLDMDIESDLGIDSIKRVEILSAMEESISGLIPVSPEIMGSLKTLDQIIEHLSAGNAPEKKMEIGYPTPWEESFQNKSACEPDSTLEKQEAITRLNRQVISVVETPMITAPSKSIYLTRTVYITKDNDGLSQAIAQELASRSITSVLVPWDTAANIQADPAAFSDACGLIIVPDGRRVSDAGRDPQDSTALKDAFSITKQLAPALLEAAETHDALFATVTRLDGAFGFRKIGIRKPILGGLAGLAKTAAIEWKSVRCRAIDIAPDWNDTRQIAHRIVSELLDSDLQQPVEIGLCKDARIVLHLTDSPLEPDTPTDPGIEPRDVIIVSGGARGITAATASALAKSVQPTLVLFGRSPKPAPEPEWLASLSAPGDIKQAIVKNEFKDLKPTPKDVESSFRQHMVNREIFNNLKKMKSSGSRVLYYSADIRNPDDITRILNEVRANHGPIRGLIHGAGVLQDRLIVDKTKRQFEQVLDTKIRGLQVMLNATDHDPLKYILLFSSVTARMGNPGQVDYAMANEVLNKMAQHESIARPDCKTIAVNWGPWDGGMVTDSLKREFTQKQIGLIPLKAGAESLLMEMTQNAHAAEVVISSAMQPKTSALTTDIDSSNPSLAHMLPKRDPFQVMLNRDIDLRQYPILKDHQLDGIPVVPFALLTEWVGHGALHNNPGLMLQGVDDMRLFKGIRMDCEKKMIRLLASKAKKKGAVYEVDVEIRNGVQDVKEVLHSKARAILSDRLLDPPAYHSDKVASFGPYSKSIDEVYEKILFHGHALQGIKAIVGLSVKGMAANISAAPPPESWMAHPMRSRWIGDPLVLDSAFQMACVWCYEQKAMVSLPSYIAAYRQYCGTFPETDITAVLEISSVTDHKMTGDFTFLNSGGTVVAQLTGYEAVMDTSLSKAFKPEFAKSA